MVPLIEIVTSAPGRVCLFGEHLDYLGLPVIAAAIGLRMQVMGGHTDGQEWIIDKPDLNEHDRFPGRGEVSYGLHGGGNFLRAAVNVLRREGVALPGGAHFHVRGNVPVQAGTSSSSALQVAWIAALLALAEDPRAGDAEAIARLAYVSEVHEFGHSGGVMDQYTSALGGLVRIDPARDNAVTRLPARLGAFVLGNSKEPKDTQGILSRLRRAAHGGAEQLRQRLGTFDWDQTPLAQAEELANGSDELAVTLGALRNRDLLEHGHRALSREEPDHAELGRLLTAHHAVLRDALGISTPKIERMLEAALAAGALGGKINGSGGGGCMFAYAPDRPEDVAEAIRGAGGEAWVVRVAQGVRRELHRPVRESHA